MGQIVDVIQALGRMDIGHREDVYHTMRALLVRRREHLGLFDRAFDASGSTNPFALALAAAICLGSVWMGALGTTRIPARTSADRTNFGEAAHV